MFLSLSKQFHIFKPCPTPGSPSSLFQDVVGLRSSFCHKPQRRGGSRSAPRTQGRADELIRVLGAPSPKLPRRTGSPSAHIRKLAAPVTHSLLGCHDDIPLQELMDSREIGAGRLSRVESLAPAVKQNTSASGCELVDAEMQALRADWKQWEDSVLRTQTSLEDLVSQMALSEQEFSGQVAHLEQALGQFSALLTTWTQQLALLEGKNTDQEIVECWQKGQVSWLPLVCWLCEQFCLVLAVAKK